LEERKGRITSFELVMLKEITFLLRIIQNDYVIEEFQNQIDCLPQQASMGTQDLSMCHQLTG
jgi:hypothetical protein